MRKITPPPLTEAQCEAVRIEIDRSNKWIYYEVRNQSPGWLVAALGWQELNAIAHAEVADCAAFYSPDIAKECEFGAFARKSLRWAFWKLKKKMAMRWKVWKEMPEIGSSPTETLGELRADHRHQGPDPLTPLQIWHLPEYAAQRRALDMRRRIILYLRFVEYWTLQEISEALGITRERARQIEDDAIRRMARRRRQLRSNRK